MEPTVNSDPTLAGQIMTNLPLQELLPIVSTVFERSEVRESSHYAEGRYIRIELGHDVTLIFERCSTSEYLVHGDADFPGDLMQAAELLKVEFAAHGLVHRFEVYRGDQLFGECSHNWPTTLETPTEQDSRGDGDKPTN